MKFPEAIGTREILIGAAVLVVLLVATIPLVGYVRDKSKRSEVPLLVESIRAAEMAQGTSFQLEGFISAEWAPRAPTTLDGNAVEWQGNEGFQRLGWSPETEGYTWIRGTYRVAATRGGFTVTGKCDLDGDGNPAWYEATADKAATPRSDAGAY